MKYGVVGREVGPIGRWIRLGWGLFILASTIVGLTQDLRIAEVTPGFLGWTALYLGGIAVGYVAAYVVLEERVLARSGTWLNTLFLVGPAFLVVWWNLAVAPWMGLTLPSSLVLAMGLYIGVSFVLQWVLKYGGCEVVSLPILLFDRRYVSYCIPLVAVDAAEKQLSQADSLRARLLWGAMLAGFVSLVLGTALEVIDSRTFWLLFGLLGSALGVVLVARRVHGT